MLNFSFEKSFYNTIKSNPNNFRNNNLIKHQAVLEDTNLSPNVCFRYLPTAGMNSNFTNSNGLFYITELSNSNLNFIINQPEALNASTYLNRQGTIANNLRWAYRYNVLHRRTTINSHKITEVKRLLSGGFFTSDISSNNL
jgi:hypothetical protein